MSDLSSEVSNGPSISDILKTTESDEKKKVKRKAPRFIRKWTPGEDYELVRKGVVLDKKPEKLAEKLGPRSLFLFKHKKDSSGDQVVSFGEDKDRPLWYGVFKPHDYPVGVYYQLTQDLEKSVYKTRPAKEMPKGFHVEDGTPYWTDSYYHKKLREKRNKKRHTSKINDKKHRKKLIGGFTFDEGEEKAEVDDEIVISGGLPIDHIMFHSPTEKLGKTLIKNGYINESKPSMRTMITASHCVDIRKRVDSIVGALFSSNLDTRNGKESSKGNKKKTKKGEKSGKNVHQGNMQKKPSSDFTAKSFNDPPKVEELPDVIIDYIRSQFDLAKSGLRGKVADAMWANSKDYQNSSIPVQRVISNSTGNLILSYHAFLQKRGREEMSDH